MYVQPVSRPSAPGAVPVGVAGIEEYLPDWVNEQLAGAGAFKWVAYGVGALFLLYAAKRVL